MGRHRVSVCLLHDGIVSKVKTAKRKITQIMTPSDSPGNLVF